jgi:hypothetical protein
MARPEKPITGDGPVADLARALRAARVQAGTPSYKELARKAFGSASVLAEAASGQRCPSWHVVESFGAACDADLKSLRSLWIKADKSDRAGRRAAHRSQSPELATVRRLPRTPTSDPPSMDPRAVRGPDPWVARTPQEYVHQLRALRAWGGNPGVREVYAHAPVPRFYSSRSTFYAALNSKRTSMPPLAFVEMLVRACRADVGEWVSAWRILSLREFEKANPSPISSDLEVPSPGSAQDATVRALG